MSLDTVVAYYCRKLEKKNFKLKQGLERETRIRTEARGGYETKIKVLEEQVADRDKTIKELSGRLLRIADVVCRYNPVASEGMMIGLSEIYDEATKGEVSKYKYASLSKEELSKASQMEKLQKV